MQQQDSINNYIVSNNLASAMNKTKWRKLAALMASNPDFNPLVKIKYLLDNESEHGFAHQDWEWVKFGDSRVIEWMQIDPIRRDYVGRLIDDVKVDFTEWVKTALLSNNIHFEEAGGLFRIRGYIRPNT